MFNASFFVWCGAFFYLVWRWLSWYAIFLISIKYQ